MVEKTRRKTIDEMSLIDDFLMACVASDPHVGAPCIKKILSILLQKEFAEVRVTAQKLIPGNNPGLRGIRMDVEVEEIIKDNGVENIASVYDLEPHKKDNTDIPHRNRFYQAKIDSKHLPAGTRNFGKLPDLYVIMILDYDPFGEDRVLYTFRNCCIESPALPYEDGLTFMIFYTEGKIGGSQKIKNMLNYIQSSKVTDNATKEINDYVVSVKADPEVKEDIMTLGDHFDMEREAGRAEGRAEGERKFILDLLADLGDVQSNISDRLDEISDEAELSRLLKIAAKAKSIQEFEKALN